jgi:hypothetical protein
VLITAGALIAAKDMVSRRPKPAEPAPAQAA